jgi:hypothetical protein
MDAMMVVLDSNGAPSWGRADGGRNYDEARAVVVNAAGGIFVGGVFRGLNVRMGSFILHNQLQQSRYYVISASGEPRWRDDRDAYLTKVSSQVTPPFKPCSGTPCGASVRGVYPV